jgi:hypothetical protein
VIDSNIIHIHAVGNDFIIVNSFDAAIELGDRRSAIYSSRWVSAIQVPERYSLNPCEDQFFRWSVSCKLHRSCTSEISFSSITWTEQDGLGLAVKFYDLWRSLERTPTHVSKVFSCFKYPILPTHTDGIHSQNVAPPTRRTE